MKLALEIWRCLSSNVSELRVCGRAFLHHHLSDHNCSVPWRICKHYTADIAAMVYKLVH